jgi:signal transduction histidine kinase
VGVLFDTAVSDLHRRRRGSRDPVAIVALPQGAFVEVNAPFRRLFGVPDPLPPDLTLGSLASSDLERSLRNWDGTGRRVFRRAMLGGIVGTARLVPLPASVPVQALLQFAPDRDDPKPEEDAGHFERLRALGETAAVVVHQIRIPLSTVQLGLDSIRTSPSLEASLSPRLDLALEQLSRLDRLLGSISAFSRPRRPSVRSMEVRRTLTDALAAVESALRGPRTTVALQVRPDPLWIMADPEWISEVIQNLIVNAVEARPDGGVIHLSAASHRTRPGWVEIRVVDQGPGIPPFLLDRVFQPFFTTKRTGTGLGLAIVKNLVELHGGAVSLTSEPGRGTTVQIDLPAGNRGCGS